MTLPMMGGSLFSYGIYYFFAVLMIACSLSISSELSRIIFQYIQTIEELYLTQNQIDFSET